VEKTTASHLSLISEDQLKNPILKYIKKFLIKSKDKLMESI